jgi:hypothetical protein
MSSETSNESGPDLAQGVPIESLGEAGLLSGHVGNDAVMNSSQLTLPVLTTTARRGHGAVPMASRLLQPAHGGSGAGSGSEPCRVLVRGGSGRQGCRSVQENSICRFRVRAGRSAAEDRHRRRRGCRFRRC